MNNLQRVVYSCPVTPRRRMRKDILLAILSLFCLPPFGAHGQSAEQTRRTEAAAYQQCLVLNQNSRDPREQCGEPPRGTQKDKKNGISIKNNRAKAQIGISEARMNELREEEKKVPEKDISGRIKLLGLMKTICSDTEMVETYKTFDCNSVPDDEVKICREYKSTARKCDTEFVSQSETTARVELLEKRLKKMRENIDIPVPRDTK